MCEPKGASSGSGDVEIKLQTVRATHQIVLHAHPTLQLMNYEVEVEDRAEKIHPRLDTNRDQQTASLFLNERIPAHTNLTLKIGFLFTKGYCKGFYSKCEMDIPEQALEALNITKEDLIRHPSGKTDDPNIYHTVELASQFEATAARQAFPCFDEPHLKARFFLKQVKLTHRNAKNMVVYFNTKGLQVTNLNGMSIWEFPEPTPIMSPYLVALVIARYTNIHSEDFEGRKLTLYHSIQQGNRGVENCMKPPSNASLSPNVNLVEPLKKATTMLAKTFLHFESYFAMKQPMNKIDVVHIPMGFGGMEHWGLITINDITVIENDPHSLACTYGYIAMLIHEAVHTWFGNFVTCSSFNHGFINEAFTHFYTNKYFNTLHPTIGGKTLHQVTRDQSIGMDTGKNSSMDAVIPLDQPNRFAASSIYSKGMIILLMLEGVVGENLFKSASVQFLAKYKYKSADTWQYLAVLQQVVNANRVIGWDNEVLNVTKFMYNWLTKKTYPNVDIAYDKKLHLITLSQCSQFSDYDWYIPVFYQIQGKDTIEVAWVIPGYQKELGESDRIPDDPRYISWDPEMRGWYNITLADELKPKPSPFKSAPDVPKEQKELEKAYAEYVQKLEGYPHF